MEMTLHLPPEVALFYIRIAQAAGKPPEQVMADALFKLAGELSLNAMRGKSGERSEELGVRSEE